MKFSLLALSGFLAGGSALTSGSRANNRVNADFMAAMHGNKNLAAAGKKARSQKIRQLHQNLIKASRKMQEDEEEQNEYEGWQEDEEIPFDMTERAFKYSGCAAIKSYDADRAQENGNPMVLDTYAVFRLCPADKCNKYSITGCGSNYGEYAVEMKSYLGYVLEYYEEKYEQYCDYCGMCDSDIQGEAKGALQNCYDDLYNQATQYANEAQEAAWQQYYEANNGDMSGYAGGNNMFQAYNNYYNQANQAQNYKDAQDAQGYSNYNAYNGGGRKLEEAANDQQNNNGQQYDQNFGYYDNNGNWVQGDQQAAQNGEGYWGADGVWYQAENGGEWVADGNGGYYQAVSMMCEDGSACDQCQYQVEVAYGKCDDYVCGDYFEYCTDYYAERNDYQFDATEFLECAAFEDEDGDVVYIGPHCGSDHFTISLGVYADENCVEYIGDQVSLADVIGSNYDDTQLFRLPTECISCDGTEEYQEEQEELYEQYQELYEQYQERQEEMAEQQQQYQNQYQYQQQQEQDYEDFQQFQEEYQEALKAYYVSSPETDENGAVAMCSALYMTSAACNMNMDNFQQISAYLSQYELDIEKRYCTFIQNIMYQSYDESGDIKLRQDTFSFNDWRNPGQYKTLGMSTLQGVFLSLSIILCVALAALAFVTQRTLTRTSSPWAPKRSKDMESSDFARESSGIVMGRSRSGPGAAPLI